MALIKNFTNTYGKIDDFFKSIIKGQAPEKFTQQYLKDLGYSSTNDRPFIPLLKALGFLSDDGTPTQRYHDYRNNALSRKIMGEAVKEAYSDIFTLRETPTENDEDIIKGKFKSTFNFTDKVANSAMKTFYALYNISEMDNNETPSKIETPEEPKEENKINAKLEQTGESNKNKDNAFPSLNYNIQVHLPATKDVEVYNAIFKSLKEHLID